MKLQQYWVKKPLKMQRKSALYRGVLLRVPKKFHSIIDPYVGLDLSINEMTIREADDEHIINIVLSTKVSGLKAQRKMAT